MPVSNRSKKTLVYGFMLLLAVGSGPGCSDDDADPGNDGGVDGATVDDGGGDGGPICGNGTLDGLEECDNGAGNSDFEPDACRTDCTLARCGDQVLDSGEECDDGRYNSDVRTDACRLDCIQPWCGDGVLDLAAGESCEDGNSVDGDGCSSTCRAEYCTNGLGESGEVCDDGNGAAGDGCAPDCLSDETCGNGRPDFATGETCDCGTDALALPAGCTAINGDVSGSCNASCQSLFCGNSVIDGLEVCDDGNNAAGDGCSPDCLSDETCGNGRPDFGVGEHCDCGTDPGALPAGCVAVNGGGNGRCRADCKLRFCGNGLLDSGEVCDDGNNLNGDTCSGDCRSDESCGNGTIDAAVGELCDDGNTVDGDACLAICTLPSCGDGVLDPGEVCDDGGNQSGDGCNAQCSSEEQCGNGIIDLAIGEQCDDGNLVGGDGCGPNCLLPYCGNGTVDVGEVCDDSNSVSGDGCSADCRSDETCGNGFVDIVLGEQCDDGDLDAGDGCDGSCHLELGWTCVFQPSACNAFCGDDQLVGTEICDGSDLGGADCTTLGFTSGNLVCYVDCSGHDTSGCQ